MATASVTNTFTASTPALAGEVNTNFTDLTGFLNDNAIQKDGSKVMTGNLDMGNQKIVSLAGPSLGSDAATKTYVDTEVAAAIPSVTKLERTTNIALSAMSGSLVTFESETDPDGWWASGSTITCPATGTYAVAVEAEFTGTSTSNRILLREVSESSTSTSNAAAFGIEPNYSDPTNRRVTGGSTVLFRSGQQFEVYVYNSDGSNSSTCTNMRLSIIQLGEW